MDFLIFALFQIVLFVPFFINWLNDCRKFGKDNLALSLEERFIAWLIFCPIWILPFLVDKK